MANTENTHKLSTEDRDTLAAKVEELRALVERAENQRGEFRPHSSLITRFYGERMARIDTAKVQIAAIEAVLSDHEPS